MRVILVAFLLLAACGTNPVYLKNRAGTVVQCGPFYKGGYTGHIAAAQHESQCIGDYQRQGYERVMAP